MYILTESLLGETLLTVVRNGDSLLFTTKSGRKILMNHIQHCCEGVTLVDICGSFGDLLGSPLIIAEESTNAGERGEYDTFTWTFYRFATIKGYVTLRWLGESNGYYSESVDLQEYYE